jgi:glucose-1-phosphatase
MHTLFFDFGNVVGCFDHRIAVRKIIRHCDLDEDACYDAIYDTALENDFEAGRFGADEFIRRACETIKYRGSPDQFRSAFIDIFRPNPGVCGLIPRLGERYRLVLASNTNELHATHFRAQFADVLGHFAALGLSYEAGVRKPQRGYFEYCQKLAECRPEECLFIDDLPANVEGARAYGWNAIQYADHSAFLAQLRHFGIDV